MLLGEDNMVAMLTPVSPFERELLLFVCKCMRSFFFDECLPSQ